MNSKILKFLRISLICLSIFIILVVISVQLSAPWVREYKPKIEQYVSETLGRPVEIMDVEPGWHYFEPVIRLSGISIQDNSTHTITTIDNVALGLDLLSSLWHWKLEPGVLIASQVDVRLDYAWLTNPVLQSGTPISLEQVFPFVVIFKRVTLNDVNVYWKNETGQGFPSFKIANAFFKLKRKYQGFYAKIELDWQDELKNADKNQPTHLFAGLNFSGNTAQKSNFFLFAQNMHFSDIQQRLKAWTDNSALSAIKIEKGLGDIQVHGNLENNGSWRIADWTCLINMTNLSWKSSQNSIPSARGLSGSLYLEPDEGNLHIDTPNLTLNYPKLFTRSLPFSNTNVQLQWKKSGEQWFLHTEKFLIENPQISTEMECDAQWKEGASDAMINLTSQFTLNNLPEIRQYLPDNVMRKKLSVWLHRSIVGGTKTTGTMILKGKLADFPFDLPNKSNGLFLVESDWDNFTLDFKEGWPAGKSMQAHVTFRNRDLLATIHSGTIDQLPLTNIKAQILALGLETETLKIQGHIQTNATNARSFILNSPLKQNLSFFNDMLLTGPGIFNIAIQIPLYPENNTNLVDGDVAFLNNDLILKKWWNLDIQHVKGNLKYNQEGVIKSQLNGTLLGHPLSLNMKTIKKPTPTTIVNTKGKISITALKKIFPLSFFNYMKGETSFSSQLNLTTSKKEDDSLVMQSSLEGISINFPSPYGKKAIDKRPLTLTLNFSDEEVKNSDTKLSINYNNQLNFDLAYYASYDGKNKKFAFHNGKISVGGKKKKNANTNEGLMIEINSPHFDADEWASFFENQNKAKGSSLNPMDIPALNIQADDLYYKKMHLGKVHLVTLQDKPSNALVIKELTFQAPSTSANFVGAWQQKSGHSTTQMRGTLLSSNLKQTLKNLDIQPVIQSQKGELNVDLFWADSPDNFSAALLNGTANLKLNKGVITHLSQSMESKVGMGKLLNILSLHTLSRGLTLDFSDLSGDGLNFDTLEGSFTLKNGNMTTKNTTLDSSVADIKMTGSIDMGKKLYDLIINIAPNVTSSVPIIATIAGGPVVGLAALAATTLIHQGMKHSSIYSYKVVGPWSHPTMKEA